jgi:hypothetical protein
MLYKIYSFILVVFFSLSVAGQSDKAPQANASAPKQGTLEFEEYRAINGQEIYSVGRILTYASIIPMYTGSMGGSTNREFGITFIPINAVYGLTTLTVNHIGMLRCRGSLRRASEKFPDNEVLKYEYQQYRFNYLIGSGFALLGATSITFGTVLGTYLGWDDGPHLPTLIPLTLGGFALIGVRDMFWTKAVKGSIKAIRQSRTPHRLPEITTYLWIPASGGLGMRVSVEL